MSLTATCEALLRISSKGFKTQLRLSDGKSVTFGNLSWRSLTDMDRNDAGYHAFVSALAAAIARANPRARFVAGKPFAFWLALATVSALSMLMLVFFTGRAFLQGTNTIGLFGVLLVACMLAFPGGIQGLAQSARRRLRRRPPSAPTDPTSRTNPLGTTHTSTESIDV